MSEILWKVGHAGHGITIIAGYTLAGNGLEYAYRVAVTRLDEFRLFSAMRTVERAIGYAVAHD